MNILYQKNFQRVLGTWQIKGDQLLASVNAALEVGYRAFDTAQLYDNEADVGKALGESGLKRDEFCVVTKINPNHFNKEKFIPSLKQSLEDLRLDAVDVLLLHWPPENGDITESVNLLGEAHAAGLANNIGVSNYTIAMMKQAKTIIDAPIITNQVEFHPLLDQHVLLQGANEVGIPLMSYCAIAQGAILQEPLLAEIAKGYGKNAVQVTLRWVLQKGVIANSASTNPENIRNNYDIMDFALSNVDMAKIDSLQVKNYRIARNLPWAPEWD